MHAQCSHMTWQVNMGSWLLRPPYSLTCVHFFFICQISDAHLADLVAPVAPASLCPS